MNSEILNKLNNSGFNFYFLVVDKFLDIQSYPQIKNFHLIYSEPNSNLTFLKENNTPYFCLEESGDKLEEKNSGRLLSHPKVIEYIQSTSKENGNKIAIIPFKPSAKIDLLCKKMGWINISNPSDLNRLFEDKIKFYNLCLKNNLPLIESSIDSFDENNFKKYQSVFGKALVIQTHFGWAGNCTYMAENFNDIENNITNGTIVKFSPFKRGYSLLNNCCLTTHGLLQSPPALQYTGIKPYTQNQFTTVGRQWPSLTSDTVKKQINSISFEFSKILQGSGYKGFFGLDFLVNSGKVYLLECNPRLTASFAFYTKIELFNNITPLFWFHILEFLNIPYEIDFKIESSRFFNESIIGSEITLKDANSNTIKKHNDFQVFSSGYDPIIIKPEISDIFLK